MRSMRWGILAALVLMVPLGAQATRPMTFMDVMEMRGVGGGSLSPDG